MTLKDDVNAAIVSVRDTWNVTRSQPSSNDVPDPENMGYTDAKAVSATYLYTDMVDSSRLVAIADKEQVASVIAAFLKVTVRIIRYGGGHIRSFDGDRVMGIFTGDGRQSNATRGAMRINWAVDEVLNYEVNSQFGSIEKSIWNLRSMSGIASGDALLGRVS